MNEIRKCIFTGRNEVVAKVMFLQVCVCPQGGRVSASVHAGKPYPPPPGPGRPPQMENPPGIRQTPWDGEPFPRTRQTTTPLGPGRPPHPGKQTPAYGLRAAGTHPTGMHSCFNLDIFYPLNSPHLNKNSCMRIVSVISEPRNSQVVLASLAVDNLLDSNGALRRDHRSYLSLKRFDIIYTTGWQLVFSSNICLNLKHGLHSLFGVANWSTSAISIFV